MLLLLLATPFGMLLLRDWTDEGNDAICMRTSSQELEVFPCPSTVGREEWSPEDNPSGYCRAFREEHGPRKGRGDDVGIKTIKRKE